MKRLIIFSLAILATSLLFADPKDPAAPFDEYSHAGTWAWNSEHRKELNPAVTDAVLASFVTNGAAATALLAKVAPAYGAAPLAEYQIGAVTQWVMVDDGVAWYDFWSDTPRADGRKVWVEALVARAETATDAYVQLFCLDQLRWCGYKCACLRARIAAIGGKSADRHVKEMVDIVLRTLE